MKIVMTIVAALAMGAPAATLSGDKALVIPAQDIQTQTAAAIPQVKGVGLGGPTLANYGNLASLSISIRTANGVGEVHTHADDLMIVEQGTATLITGGTLVDPKHTTPGEIRGTKVQGGESRTLNVGDVVIVPVGVPHQILIPPGTVYSSLLAKIKEP